LPLHQLVETGYNFIELVVIKQWFGKRYDPL